MGAFLIQPDISLAFPSRKKTKYSRAEAQRTMDMSFAILMQRLGSEPEHEG
jgi:hypothetical protein